jgi:pyruvate dehydrogenase E2 component (dihydrolipoamide acetyltransferase)
MPVNILMPALSPTMEKGNLAKWLKKEGDKVKAGDVIAEIETDKATMEYESIDDGVLAKIVVPEGTQDVSVNQLIAVLAQEGEDPKAAAAAAGKGAAPAVKAAEPPAKPTGAVTPSPQPSPLRGEGVAPGPPQAKTPPQARSAPSPHGEEGWGEGVRADGSNRIFASPLARRLAKDAGIGLARIQGSGPHGRIIARDVEAAKSGKGLVAPAAVSAAPLPIQPPSDDKIIALFEPGSFEFLPHDNMRKIIARRLVEAKLTIPHFYLTLDCHIGKLLAAREEINAAAPKDKDGKPAYKISVNDFVIKALALALQRVPSANVSWTESGMLKHKHSDIGVAVSIQGGLITPIVRKAESKSLSVISGEMKDFAARARARRLKPEEYQGGSSAVSNLGMFGIKDFTAVINPPQTTILAVGASEERAVVRGGKIEAAWIMSVTLSCDHRAVDGALGSELIGAFKTLIENPVMMVV